MLLATSLLSEPLFALLSIAALWLAESYTQSRRRHIGLLLSLSMMLCLLTRLAGIALVIAVVLHLKREKILKSNLLILIPPVVALGLWLAWGRGVTSGDDGRQLSYYTSYFQDWMHVLSDHARQTGQSVIISSALLVLKNLLMSLVASTSVIILGFPYRGLPILWGFPIGLLSIVICFSLLLAGFAKKRRSHPGIIHAYTVTYLLLHILWPYTAYDRFLMPILPFLLLYLICPVSGIALAVKDGFRPVSGGRQLARAGVAASVVVIGILFVAHNYMTGTRQHIDETRRQKSQSATCDIPLYAWLDANTKPSDILICYQDVKCYLFTGRKAVRNPFRISDQYPEHAMEESILRHHADYLILRADDFSLESRPEFARNGLRSYVQAHPARFASVLKDGDCDTAVFRIISDE